MHKLGLFIKSYNGHLEYTKQLVETIKKFNVDNIPTFVSVPKSQVGLFDDIFHLFDKSRFFISAIQIYTIFTT